MQIKKLESALGAEVTGLDVSKPISRSDRDIGLDTSRPVTSAPNADSSFLICMATGSPRRHIASQVLRAGGITVLFQLNAARLDRAFPSLDLGGEELREIFRRATIRRNHIAPYLFETLLDGRLVERGDGSLVELLHDRWRRDGGKAERIPAWGIEVRQPLLVGGL